ncbi:MAG: cbb3-type cytochrome c oxidase subunit 3 [Bdellovibrionota bacterium]|mgnify:CR=1 FL=1|nr:cbb3-type cytochrome c oxidase subunit 3 [Bdellovibrionota bacterium]
MRKEVFANMDLSTLPSIGLICFLAVFIGVLLWSYRKGSKDLYKEISNGILDKE